MIIVKLTYNYNWPLFRQTENNSQVWGNYKFIIDENLKECDFWIVYTDYNLKAEKIKCNPENIIFIPAECFNTSPKFNQNFLNQFGLIITVQRELKHRNIIYTHNANPWFVGKSYDELQNNLVSDKTKLISVVSSNKAFTDGHRKRLEFVQKLKNHFGDQLDIFGRGINDFDDKWDVLADYKYTIAIENDFCEDWVTEKYFDCIYANTLPFYYGCPNLEEIVNKDSFIRIDINNLEQSIKIIEYAIISNEFENRKNLVQSQKIKSLNEDQFFPWIVSILESKNTNLKKRVVQLKLNTKRKNVFFKVMKSIYFRIKSII
ncbi:glycosyltransferase family 10 domain-containing protein [Flavobacterium facile]|uniref:glycosyltransferase family 10 domain-containing protein n=1 Tax=Flavobacterium facile TaxID=2893174 RepID=UPI002E79FBA6|nr:glycosyltransferase family 10 [Flavobacterium sp. T-12]